MFLKLVFFFFDLRIFKINIIVGEMVNIFITFFVNLIKLDGNSSERLYHEYASKYSK